MSCLPYNTDNFLTVSHNFWSLLVVIFALYHFFSCVLLFEEKLFKKLFGSPCVLRSHYKNEAASQLLMYFCIDVFAYYSYILASLRQCCLTLHLLHSCSHSVRVHYWCRNDAEVVQTLVNMNQAESLRSSACNFSCNCSSLEIVV